MYKNIANIAKKLDIGTSTLYQWRKTRPKLYNFLINNSTLQKQDILIYFNKLTKQEKELYFAEIKAIILRREILKNKNKNLNK